MHPGERLTVTCDDLDDEAAGVAAAADGRLVVAGALPGERVAVEVAHVSAHAPQAWARLLAIEAPSPARRPPACPAFGACGGCALQHLAYEEQLAWKHRRVTRALAGLGSVPIDACVASPRTLGYRNKSKLVAARAGARLALGAYAPRSHGVVDVAGCAIAEPPLDAVAAALRARLDGAGVTAYDERTLTGALRHVVLRVSHAGDVLVALVVAGRLDAGPALARALRAARPEIVGVVEHDNRTRGNVIFAGDGADRVLDGAGTIEEAVDAGGARARLRLSARAFFQANRGVAGLAYAAIARGLDVQPTDLVVDAYAGVGGIALLLAPHAREVIGVESHAGAVADAEASAALNEISNARFVAADAAIALAAIDRADLIVVNPPRKGCAPAVLTEIARLAPRAIAYLSCDPDTLARDLAALGARGYHAGAITPFDMLPHTPHVEALAIVRRVNG